MKFISTFFITLLSFHISYSQIEQPVTSSNKNMSMGLHTGHKIVLPTQELGTAVKIVKNTFKDRNAEAVDVPKESNEIIYSEVYLKEKSNPLKVVSVMEQQGKNVGWTAYYFDNENNEVNDSKAISTFMNNIYRQSMIDVYDDSIKIQQRVLSRAEKELSSMSNNTTSNKKDNNKNSQKISSCESQISQSENNISNLQSRLTDLQSKKTEAQNLMSETDKMQGEVDIIEDGLDDLMSSHKDMNKRLSKLEKNPAENANLITAQRKDIEALNSKISDKKKLFESRNAVVSQESKMAKNSLKSIEKDIKKTEKDIKKEQKNISKLQDKITDYNGEIQSNEKDIAQYESEDKTKQEAIITSEKEKLEYYQSQQDLYR